MNYSFHNNRKIDRLLNRMGLAFVIEIKNQYKTKSNIKKNQSKKYRMLEIGPGLERLPDFETLNIIDGKNVDYIHDILFQLPFKNESFDLIYASHVMEHIPWYLQKDVFDELYRILKPTGKLEIWVPDGLKIIKMAYDYEINNINNIHKDGWYRFNEEKDVITWVNGRIFTYGDGSKNINHHNWHKTIYTPHYLEKLFNSAGFREIKLTPTSKVRGYDHGWINLGMEGEK